MSARTWGMVTAAVAMLSSLVAGSPGPAGAAVTPVCSGHRLPVALAPGQPDRYEVAGRLCAVGAPAGRTVQLLVHGFTQSDVYFDFPLGDGGYSYVRVATLAGYATFNLNRLGVTPSDRPPAVEVTLDSNAFVIHQVVEHLRAGHVGGTPFERVVLVAHSFGTAIAIVAAARHGDVDAVAGASFLHTADGPNPALFVASSYPAQLDSRFRDADLPPGYVTTTPGFRGRFYADADAEVIALDEATKATGTYGEILSFGAYFSPAPRLDLHGAPVLLLMGERDPFFCNAVLSCRSGEAVTERERPYFADGTHLEGLLLPNVAPGAK